MRSLVVVIVVPLGEEEDAEATATALLDAIPAEVAPNQRLGVCSYAESDRPVRHALLIAVRSVSHDRESRL